jgi:hypothetical protein
MAKRTAIGVGCCFGGCDKAYKGMIVIPICSFSCTPAGALKLYYQFDGANRGSWAIASANPDDKKYKELMAPYQILAVSGSKAIVNFL